ncbi:16S rRNA methyltransferase [Ectothiorhodospira haloalkaliphila]|uniref:Ribosomal RNA small subunit methyltransferase G n=1 Tax=Ectothiorhodospira haloalkaliphila TaxID=421628 RepID=W8KY78_9GAMM|nr:16S rRNA methyltransferase [Ectothiorhodospira haloalkaliphila]
MPDSTRLAHDAVHPFPPHVGERLARGLGQLGLDADLKTPLLAYVSLLTRWNKAYNLTAVRDPRDMVNVHLLDSLAALPHARGPRILDVGTGPGLPGIPLALTRPDWQFVLLDSGIKKTRFLRQVVMELGLGNVEVVHSRVENYRPDQGFDTVMSRAFSATGTFTRVAGHLCGPGGQLLAMKGRDADNDPEGLPAGWSVVATHSLRVPGLSAVRHLVEIKKDS